MAQKESSRLDKLLFHTAFDRGIPITGFLDRAESTALSNVSKTASSSMRHVLEKRGIRLFHASFRESDFYFPNAKIWTVTFQYTGQEKTAFFNMVVKDRDSLTEYINANTFVTYIIQTKPDELELTFACAPLDRRRNEIDEQYIYNKISDMCVTIYDTSEGAYDGFFVKHVRPEYDESKLGRRSRKSKNRKRRSATFEKRR